MKTGVLTQEAPRRAAKLESQAGLTSPSAVETIHSPSKTMMTNAPRPIKAGTRSGRSTAGASSPALSVGRVTGKELQSALLVVLALYASMAVMDLPSEFTSFVQQWQGFIEFLAASIF